MNWGVASLRPNFFSSGRIFLAELAQESWRDLAAVARKWPGATAGQGVSIHVLMQKFSTIMIITREHHSDTPGLLSDAPWILSCHK